MRPAALALALTVFTAVPQVAHAATSPVRSTMGLLGAPAHFTGNPFTTTQPLGDVNADGFADVALGDSALGQVRVVFGQSVHANVDLSKPSTRVFPLPAGSYAEGAGDVNGDGKDDLLLYAPTAGGFTSAVVFGATDIAATRLDRLGNRGFFVLNGIARPAGDLDANGKDDLIVSASAGSGRKLVYVRGRAAGGTLDAMAIGAAGGDFP
ncbi:MAG: VCBS repeat-containing protein [Solirubrobacteraceae bacterium]|nr:VCBS repeat-containing protein [Solirubrobacteraceae bacterium]